MSGPPSRTPPSRRTFLTAAVAGLGAAAVGTAAHGDALQVPAPARVPRMTGYAPDGTAGLTRAFPLSQVKLLTGAFEQNRRRNTSYLLFLDADRLLRSFRLNYGLKSAAEPCGGWEAPDSEVRGHNTGHLLSALALTWASTGNPEARDKGRYIVRELAALQGRAAAAGFSPGYLSAFPEDYFDRLEAGRPVWSPYYMIHKYLAGFIDQYQLAGDETALDRDMIGIASTNSTRGFFGARLSARSMSLWGFGPVKGTCRFAPPAGVTAHAARSARPSAKSACASSTTS